MTDGSLLDVLQRKYNLANVDVLYIAYLLTNPRAEQSYCLQNPFPQDNAMAYTFTSKLFQMLEDREKSEVADILFRTIVYYRGDLGYSNLKNILTQLLIDRSRVGRLTEKTQEFVKYLLMGLTIDGALKNAEDAVRASANGRSNLEN